MANVDKIYFQLSRGILENGYIYTTDNRPDVPCIQVSSAVIDIPLSEFPLLTTKKMFFKGIVAELLWFLQGQDTTIPLVNQGVQIWDKDAYNFYCKACDKAGLKKISFEDFMLEMKNPGTVQWDAPSPDFTLGDVGRNYGVQWRKWNADYGESMGIYDGEESFEYRQKHFDQIQNLIENLRKLNPINRRHIVTAWNPAELDNTALPPCHWAFEILPKPLSVRNKMYFASADAEYLETLWSEAYTKGNEEAKEKLMKEIAGIPDYGFSLKWHQRSVDTFLGLPFNIASYALLAQIIGDLTGMVALSVVGDLSNIHFYTKPENSDSKSHVELIKQQLERNPAEYVGPTLIMSGNYSSRLAEYKNDEISLTEFFLFLETEDFTLLNYNSYPALKGDMYAPTENL